MSELSVLDLGGLEPFHAAGVVDVTDVHVAATILRLGDGRLDDPADLPVALGAALCVRALRAGSVCVDLAADPSQWVSDQPDLPWPENWASRVWQHPLVSHDSPQTPLRMSGSLLYLQRYWQDEDLIRTQMRIRGRLLTLDLERVRSGLDRLFPDQSSPDRQRLAVAVAALRQVTIVAGGPGTGKTTTVARILALLHEVADVRSVALAAPTGKAAARLQQAVTEAVALMDAPDRQRVGDVTASTLHRLLGWRPDAQGRFRHDSANPLPHDVVIVDETSMVSLPLMARLLEAVRPDARLVLVGDPDQLASIDAGAVLGDLVAAAGQSADPSLVAALNSLCPSDAASTAAATGVVTLTHNYRFEANIARLATAIHRGDADEVIAVLRRGAPDVRFIEESDYREVKEAVAGQAQRMVACARAGEALAALHAMDEHRLLCAHREGPFGVSHWNDLLAAWSEPFEDRVPGDEWWPGRPLMVTANDYEADLYNGDTGVIVAAGLQRRAAFARAGDVVLLPVNRLDTVQTLRAMTIHRGQGSQFDAVTVILPDADSALLTRELLYTAVTRARNVIRIVATEDAVRAAVGRQVRRASGLRQ